MLISSIIRTFVRCHRDFVLAFFLIFLTSSGLHQARVISKHLPKGMHIEHERPGRLVR
jgi:hypothetical protein